MTHPRVTNVSEEYRKNDLSKIAGGHEISVTKKNGEIVRYDNIKKPRSYMLAMSTIHVAYAHLDGMLVFTQEDKWMPDKINMYLDDKEAVAAKTPKSK